MPNHRLPRRALLADIGAGWKRLTICLVKARLGLCWSSLMVDNWEADSLVVERIKQKLMLERLQVENPGLDFSSAEISGNNVDKTLLYRTFLPACEYEKSKCILSKEARSYYESLTQCVDKKSDSSLSVSTSRECTVCGVDFDDYEKHVSSIGHQVAEMHGYQILTRIGWRDAAFNVDEELSISMTSTNASLASTSQSCSKGSGLNAAREGRRFPIATVLKRDRLGFGWSNSTNTAKITHFSSGDIRAIQNLRNPKLSSVKKDTKYLVRKMNREKNMERTIRQEFNLTEEQLSILHGNEISLH
uniref:G-patch domain-containing protein n=1 Tax=Trichobilharzia regenti TaxID=157069 RepID=A0AA85KHR9_TRIRE|nr:unnamed protein product [Trichobilharzia regenti]